MPFDTQEIAYSVLEQLVTLTPYGSANMSWFIPHYQKLQNKVREYNQLVRDAKNIFHYSYYDVTSKNHRLMLRLEIADLARDLNMRFNPVTRCFENNPVIYSQGRYKNWYEKASEYSYTPDVRIKIQFGLLSLCLEICQHLLRHNTEEKLTLDFLKFRLLDYLYYELIQKRKTGTCGELCHAASFYLLAHTEYVGHMYFIEGCNVDHGLIVIGDDTLPEKFTLDALVKDYPNVRIIDPWLRCQFLAKDAHAYYDILNALRNSDAHGSFEFKIRDHLSPENIIQARTFYRKNDLKSLLEQKVEELVAANMPKHQQNRMH